MFHGSKRCFSFIIRGHACPFLCSIFGLRRDQQNYLLGKETLPDFAKLEGLGRGPIRLTSYNGSLFGNTPLEDAQ
jgi:hypothetical protein